MDAITEAVTALSGGQTELANHLGLPLQQVNQWVMGKRPVPAKHCPAIESLTGVTCERLCGKVKWTRDKKGAVTGYNVPLAA